MDMFLLGAHATGLVPLAWAWRANRNTTLLQAVHAALVAWIGWFLAGLRGGESLVYVSLCLTAAAGIAVLGARRPGVAAWNFVLMGLLAVMLLPLAEGFVLGRPLILELPRALFLGGTLAMILLNYLPTRAGLAALVLTASCGVELVHLAGGGLLRAHMETWLLPARVGLMLSPWLALLLMQSRGKPASEFDRIWLGFRDRFGLLWAQRMREQFQAAARNNKWPVVLRWNGLRLTEPIVSLEPLAGEILATLQALLKRFGPEEPD